MISFGYTHYCDSPAHLVLSALLCPLHTGGRVHQTGVWGHTGSPGHCLGGPPLLPHVPLHSADRALQTVSGNCFKVIALTLQGPTQLLVCVCVCVCVYVCVCMYVCVREEYMCVTCMCERKYSDLDSYTYMYVHV